MSQDALTSVAGLETKEQVWKFYFRHARMFSGEGLDDFQTICNTALRSLAPPSARGTIAHTDHPLRHWDRTCPACIAESDSVCVPRELLTRAAEFIQFAQDVPVQERNATECMNELYALLAAAPTVPAHEQPKSIMQEQCINVRCNACDRSLVAVQCTDRKCEAKGAACGLRPLLSAYAAPVSARMEVGTIQEKK